MSQVLGLGLNADATWGFNSSLNPCLNHIYLSITFQNIVIIKLSQTNEYNTSTGKLYILKILYCHNSCFLSTDKFNTFHHKLLEPLI